MLKLTDINLIFNPNSKIENHILQDINLTIADGAFVTIIGGNGAGKTSLMNIIAGEILPTSGDIYIDNESVKTHATAWRAKNVARVFQNPTLGTLADLTIEENLLIAHMRGKTRGFCLASNKAKTDFYRTLLGDLGLGLENRLHDKVSSLSGGQRQALSLVMATMLESKILLLDEHTAALDPKAANNIMELTNKLVQQNNITTLMITHSMTQALNYGTRTIMLYHGKIVQDLIGDARRNMSADSLLALFDLN